MNTQGAGAIPADPILWSLLETYCDATATAAERSQLEARLLEDPEARKFFLAYMQEHAHLAWRARGETVPSVNVRSPVLGFLWGALASVAASRVSLVLWTVAVLTNLVLVCLLALALSPRWLERAVQSFGSAPPDERRPARPARRIARVVAAAGCRWQEGSSAPGVGSELAAGRLRLSAGRVEIEFSDGARVSLAGPSEFEILSANRSCLQIGELAAYVPKRAVGFAVMTPSAEIVDLGTEFGAKVDEQGSLDVHVFKGAVEFSPRGANGAVGSARTLRADQAVRIERGGRITPIPANAESFATTRAIVPAIFPPAPRREAVTPDEVRGLRLWLSADRGVRLDAQGGVEQWSDQSGNGFDALQRDSARRPRLARTAALAGVRNAGRAAKGQAEVLTTGAIRFDGIDDFLECAGGLNLDNAADSTFFFLVCRLEQPKPNAGLFSLRSRELSDWASPDGFVLAVSQLSKNGLAASAAYDTRPGADSLQIDVPLVDPPPYLVTITRQQGVAAFRLDGALEKVDSFAILSDGGQSAVNTAGYLVGARADNGAGGSVSLHCACDIAQVIVYDRTVSPDERAAIEECLRGRSISSP